MTEPFVFPVDPPRVIVAGDWHGDTVRAREVIRLAGEQGIHVIVHLGDFGFWVPGPATGRYLSTVNKECVRAGVLLLWVDGNHEDHAELNAIPLDDTGVRRIRSNIAHLPRGFRWTWHNKTWMALGGAYSVDRYDRKLNVSWWEEETLTPDDVSRAVSPGHVDVIVAHDCPNRVNIPGLQSHRFPAYAIAESDEHQRLVGTIVDATRPSVYFHGHYHVRYTAYRHLPDEGSTLVIGLGDNYGKLADNFAVVNVKQG